MTFDTLGKKIFRFGGGNWPDPFLGQEKNKKKRKRRNFEI